MRDVAQAMFDQAIAEIESGEGGEGADDGGFGGGSAGGGDDDF